MARRRITGSYEGPTGNGEYEYQSNKKVWVLREFKNSEENKLGAPLPKGRLRFYQQDDDRQLEFIGENEIDHTPKDETIRVYVGNSFDLTGEHKRTDYKVSEANHSVEEAFEIKLRNQPKGGRGYPAARWSTFRRYDGWEIKDKESAAIPSPIAFRFAHHRVPRHAQAR